jgi:hypothetical protein
MFRARRRPLRSRLLLLTVSVAAVLAAVFASTAVQPASAHRSGCHRWHTCPSDLYTYRWRGLLCTSHHTDKLRVVYQGRTYWCHR